MEELGSRAAKRARPIEPEAVKKSLRPVLGASALFLLALLVLGGVKSWRDLMLSRERVRELEREIAVAHERIEKLERRIDNLEKDPQTLERRAREDLGLVHPNDHVLLLPDNEPAKPAER